MMRLLYALFVVILLSGCAQLQSVDAGITIGADGIDVRAGEAPPVDVFCSGEDDCERGRPGR